VVRYVSVSVISPWDGNIISADKDVDGGSESRKKYGNSKK
jgi:hypothetical protein